jgi:hypothetical protein
METGDEQERKCYWKKTFHGIAKIGKSQWGSKKATNDVYLYFYSQQKTT